MQDDKAPLGEADTRAKLIDPALHRVLARRSQIRMKCGLIPNTRLFCRRFADLMGGKSVVIAVVSTPAPDVRHWIVTAWVTGKPPKGDVEWKRP